MQTTCVETNHNPFRVMEINISIGFVSLTNQMNAISMTVFKELKYCTNP